MEQAFLKELRSLLIKHNASLGLGFSAWSDTHGMSDVGMEVTFRVPVEKGYPKSVVKKLSYDYDVCVSDLTDRIEE